MYGTIKVDASRLRPLVNTVLVKLTKITKAGGILLPDMVKDRDRLYHEWGEVVALGSAAYEEWGGSETFRTSGPATRCCSCSMPASWSRKPAPMTPTTT
jgi:hypothetical protein